MDTAVSSVKLDCSRFSRRRGAAGAARTGREGEIASAAVPDPAYKQAFLRPAETTESHERENQVSHRGGRAGSTPAPASRKSGDGTHPVAVVSAEDDRGVPAGSTRRRSRCRPRCPRSRRWSNDERQAGIRGSYRRSRGRGGRRERCATPRRLRVGRLIVSRRGRQERLLRSRYAGRATPANRRRDAVVSQEVAPYAISSSHGEMPGARDQRRARSAWAHR